MEQKQNIEQFKGQTRLPKFATPDRYDLHLKPDLSVCTFSGTICINLRIIEPTKFIVLNALELNIQGVLFTNSQNQQQYHPCDVVLDEDDKILVLVFEETLDVGDGTLRIDFSGILNEHLRGFYRCSYMDEEEKKNMAVTQFEAVDARRCFPCWDEPALKATFKTTIDVRLELTALSNMPIIDEKLNGDVKTVYFEESPLMSTYLVAVVIGLFDHIEDTTADGVKVRMYCPLGQSNKGKYALSIAVKALDLFTKYFSMPYPLPKLDMVAVPEFSGGAMENYGLIIYREIELLYDDLQSTAARKQRISYMATDSLFPEWKIWTQFLQQTNGGLCIDALEGSHPIEVEIHHARSVSEIFDAISYKKGSAKALSSYMEKYAWKNAKTEDLWSMLSAESGVQVNSMMDSWTKQKGHPVISVKSDDHFLEFEQSQFLSSGLHGEGKWIVPITLALGSYNRRKNFLLESKVERVDVCYSVLEMLIDAIPASVNELRTFFINLLLFSSEKLGWESVLGEIHLNALLRGEIYTALATFGHDKTHREAMQRFQSLLNDRTTTLLSTDTKKAAYIAIMRNASSRNRSGFESLLKILREADAVHEKERVLGCIASCPDPDIVLEGLNLLVSDEVRDQDIIYGLNGISLEGRKIAWKWLKKNWEQILNKYGDGLLITHFIRDIISRRISNEKADEVEEFFATRATPGIAMNLKQSIEQVRIKARWVQNMGSKHKARKFP
ncbi:unnamed protein product [Dovyalis caffra]|uniref:Aminopeptidase n=1 Tax=Dovyalis caffra TaxID=77055 RepID=A0AAV1SSZ0_9ROSI|nr:unnamed protein product [Dovyalis caffra]